MYVMIKQVRKELRGNSHERFFPGALEVYIYKIRNEMPIWT